MENDIRVYRKEKVMSQLQLAKLTGLYVGYICHLEKGTRNNPSKYTMQKIAVALEKTITKVFQI